MKIINFYPTKWDKEQILSDRPEYRVCVFSGWGIEDYIIIPKGDVTLIDDNTASIILPKPNRHGKYEFFKLEAI